MTSISENDIFLKESEASETTTELNSLNIESDSSPVPSPVSSLNDSTIMRPQTAATVSRESNRIKDVSEAESRVEEVHNGGEIEIEEMNIYKTKCKKLFFKNQIILGISVFHMSLVSNWGHQELIGLTGVQFLGKDGEPINLEGVTIKLCNGDPENNANLPKSVKFYHIKLENSLKTLFYFFIILCLA